MNWSTASESRSSVGTGGSVAGRGLVAQGGMPSVVVVVFPVADQHAGLGQGPEAVDVEAFIADAGVERLDVAVAPRLCH